MDILIKRDLSKNENKPYVIRQNSEEGRHLVASRDIKPGELIIQELPVCHAPGFSTRPVCLGCYAFVDGSVLCQNCNWPICSKDCKFLSDHSNMECQLYASQKHWRFDPGKVNFSDIQPFYDVISPIRVLLLKKQCPASYKSFSELQSHAKAWGQDQEWKKSHDFIIKHLRQDLKLDLDESEILEMFGIFYTNDFLVRSLKNETPFGSAGKSGDVRVIYGLISMASHSCVANACRFIGDHDQGFKHEIYSNQGIKKGDKITINYEDIFLPTNIRNKRLGKSKKFTCQCKRCKDMTELGTFAGALICRTCANPVVNQKDAKMGWKCTACGLTQRSEEEVEVLFENIQEETELLLNDTDEFNIEKLEAFLADYKNILHPFNGFMMKMKFNLCGMYGRLPGYEMNQLTIPMLKRKKILCEEVLKFLYLVEAGLSPRKGIILYELHMPTVMLAHTYYQQEIIGVQEASTEFRKALKCLKDSVTHLRMESEGSFERALSFEAEQSSKPLEQYIVNQFGCE